MADNFIVIDIETIPNEDLIGLLPTPTPSGVLKDPAKIEADIAKKREEQVQKMALDGLWGKVACIGYMNSSYQDVHIADEKEMLEEFVGRTCDKQVVTYNGKGFDIPFIAKRCAILGVKSLHSFDKWLNKYDNERHLDIMLSWCGSNKYEKLDTLAKVILGESKEEFDVSKISEYLKTDTGREMLKRYCIKDCELVYKLKRRLYDREGLF